MKPQITVTTSWDDGHVLDLKLAGLLKRYQLAGTFYISPENREINPSNRLTPDQIRGLSRDFEIGAHTLSHPRLPQVDDAAANHEIAGSKTALEAILNHPVTTFCYPGGAYTPAHLPMVEAAGYTYARTVERFKFSVGPNRFTAPTSLHAYRHWSDLPAIARFAKFHPVRTLSYLLNWDKLAMAMFDEQVRTGGIFHLWGHSWEVDQLGDWDRLERVLHHISQHQNVHYATNGELV
jgi:peptidoglycan/xylan/chitin deacetylase (PgdA/CDA1 family)